MRDGVLGVLERSHGGGQELVTDSRVDEADVIEIEEAAESARERGNQLQTYDLDVRDRARSGERHGTGDLPGRRGRRRERNCFDIGGYPSTRIDELDHHLERSGRLIAVREGDPEAVRAGARRSKAAVLYEIRHHV